MMDPIPPRHLLIIVLLVALAIKDDKIAADLTIATDILTLKSDIGSFPASTPPVIVG